MSWPTTTSLRTAFTAARNSVERLFAGYFETVLGRDELISAVVVPAQKDRRTIYLKCTTRAVHDWPALGIAVSIEANERVIRDARIVISAATERPVRLAAAEKALRGADIGRHAFAEAAEAAAAEVELTTDSQGSAAYKRELLRVYLRRALDAALADGSQ